MLKSASKQKGRLSRTVNAKDAKVMVSLKPSSSGCPGLLPKYRGDSVGGPADNLGAPSDNLGQPRGNLGISGDILGGPPKVMVSPKPSPLKILTFGILKGDPFIPGKVFE